MRHRGIITVKKMATPFIFIVWFVAMPTNADQNKSFDSAGILANVKYAERYSKNVVKEYDKIKQLISITVDLVNCINEVNGANYTFFVVYEDKMVYRCFYTNKPNGDSLATHSKDRIMDDQIQVWIDKKSLKVFQIVFGG